MSARSLVWLRVPLALGLASLLAVPTRAQGAPAASCPPAAEGEPPPPALVHCRDGHGCRTTPVSGVLAHADAELVFGPQPAGTPNVVACLGDLCTWSHISAEDLHLVTGGAGPIPAGQAPDGAGPPPPSAVAERVCSGDGCRWTDLDTLPDTLPPDATVPLAGLWHGVDEVVRADCFEDFDPAVPHRTEMTVPFEWRLLDDGETLVQVNRQHDVAVPYCRTGPGAYATVYGGMALRLVVLSERLVVGGGETADGCVTRSRLTYQGLATD